MAIDDVGRLEGQNTNDRELSPITGKRNATADHEGLNASLPLELKMCRARKNPLRPKDGPEGESGQRSSNSGWHHSKKEALSLVRAWFMQTQDNFQQEDSFWKGVKEKLSRFFHMNRR